MISHIGYGGKLLTLYKYRLLLTLKSCFKTMRAHLNPKSKLAFLFFKFLKKSQINKIKLLLLQFDIICHYCKSSFVEIFKIYLFQININLKREKKKSHFYPFTFTKKRFKLTCKRDKRASIAWRKDRHRKAIISIAKFEKERKYKINFNFWISVNWTSYSKYYFETSMPEPL